MTPLEQNLACLDQARALLSRLDDGQYLLSPAGRPRGTVGAHLRHVLDAYRCLLDGWADGLVDYDRRRRDVTVEGERATALSTLDGLRDELAGLSRIDGERPLRSRTDRHPDDPGSSASSLDRELAFLASHSVHHFALMAVTLTGAGVTLPEGFGVAPSTLRHWAGSAAGPG